MTEVTWEFPRKLPFSWFRDHKRFKVAYGGRDGGKSWNFARALLILGTQRKLRIGCFREVQRSIKDSVHKLLSDQVEALQLSSEYDVLQNTIRGKNGTEFIFSGLSSETRDSIKSYEKLNIAWVEEAQSVSKLSLQYLTPTIRSPGSEIWFSFNPSLDTDEVYQRFVINTPVDASVIKVNYDDNPWRSTALDQEREDMRRNAPDDFAHIYGGECRAAVDGAIYYKEVSELRSSGRICNVPYDQLLKVHVVWDLGYADFMSIGLIQRHASEVRIIRYIEDHHRTLADYWTELQTLRMNFGTFYLPHDGKARDYRSGKSAEEILVGLGAKVEFVEQIGVDRGIDAARLMFPRCYFDKDNASALVNRLARYRRRVNRETGVSATPLHDDESHGADMFRYLSIVADQMSNDDHGIPTDYYKAFRHG